ncbi:MAG: TolC family protein [Thermodesulfobacteriota bacterium]
MTGKPWRTAAAAFLLFVLAPAAVRGASPAPGAEIAAEESPDPAALIGEGETLSLARAVAIARRMQPAILAARGSVAAGESLVGQARSGLYPQVDGTAGYSRYSPAGVAAGLGGEDGAYSQYTAGVTARQLLYDFGRTSARVAVRRTAVDAARADLGAVEDLIVYNVKLAYFDLLKTGRHLGVATETVAQFEAHLLQAKGFFDSGVKPKYDVTKAEVDLSNARLERIRAENALRLARVTLNTAMGVPAAPFFEVEDNLDFQPFSLPLAAAMEKAYAGRPDLKALERRQRLAEQAVALARKGDSPTVSGQAGGSLAGETFPLDEGWDIGVVLSVPLFNGHRTRHEVGEAEANLVSAAADLTALRQAIHREVQQGYLQLAEAEERISTLELTVRQAEENYRIAAGRYAAGVGNPVEVTDAEITLANARTAHVQALYDYRIAASTIEKAVGIRMDEGR